MNQDKWSQEQVNLMLKMTFIAGCWAGFCIGIILTVLYYILK